MNAFSDLIPQRKAAGVSPPSPPASGAAGASAFADLIPTSSEGMATSTIPSDRAGARARPDESDNPFLDLVPQREAFAAIAEPPALAPAGPSLTFQPDDMQTLIGDSPLRAGLANREAIRAQVEPPGQLSEPYLTGKRLKSAGSSVMQGFGKTLAGVPKGFAVNLSQQAQQALADFDAIDRGEAPQSPIGGPSAQAQRYLRADPKTRAGMRAETIRRADPRNLEAYQAGEALERRTKEAFPTDPEIAEEFFAGKVPQALGSTAAFLGGGVAGRALGAPRYAVPAIGGGLVSSEQVFKDAIAKGASLETALKAARIGPASGAMEAIPVERLLTRLDKLSGGQISKIIANAAKTGTEEGVQEAAQQIAENLTARGYYDPERGVFKDADEQGAVGFSTGSILGFLTGLVGGRRGARADFSAREGQARPRVEPFVSAPPEASTAAPSPEPAPSAPIAPPPSSAVSERPAAAAAPPLSGERPPSPRPAPPIPRDRPAAGDYAITPRGRKVAVDYEVVEADQLVTSHDDALRENPNYPQDLQPRDRTRAASEEQIARIAQGLMPELLGPSLSAADGAPIVGEGNAVESGNGRVLALRRAYGQDLPGAADYRAFLRSHGFDVDGFEAPVLVRRRATPLSPAERAAFAREANERPTLDMAVSETAAADARAMPDWLIEAYRGGDLGLATNREFVRRFMDGVVSSNERARLVTSAGELSQEGRARVEAALFAKAWRDAGLLAGLREDRESNLRSIGSAMTDAAAPWAKMRAAAITGTIPANLDATGSFLEAVDVVRKARASGRPVAELVAQQDAFNGLSPEGEAWLGLIFKDRELRRPVSRERLADALRFYADEAMKAKPGSSLFGGMAEVTPLDILAAAARRGQGALFAAGEEVLAQRAPAAAGDGAENVFADLIPTGRPAAQPAIGQIIAGQDGKPGANPFADLIPDAETLASRGGGQTLAAAAGRNYLGPRRDAPPTGAREIAGPKRRDAILKKLAEALGVPFYKGRIPKQSKMLGFYRPRTEEIRTRRANDLETAIHEAAHLLDYRIPEIRRQWHPATSANTAVRAELRAVSYDQDKLFEGFAEFVRLWATQPAEALSRAPRFFAWWEQFLDRSGYGPAIRAFKTEALAWYEQDALLRAASKIGPVEAVSEVTRGWRDRLRQSVFDDLHGILEAERRLRGGPEPMGPYELARLTRAKESIIEGALVYGAPVVMPDGSHSFQGKGLKQILEPVARELDRFWLYAVGRSSAELLSQGREHLFTRNEIAAMLALQTPEFARAFDEYQAWNSAILDFAQAKGLIDPAKRALWRRAAYLPFYRVNAGGGSAASKGAPGDWRGIKALTGGTANLRDVMSNVIQNAAMLIDAALTNEARISVADMVSAKGGAEFMVRIPSEERVAQASRDSVERAILEALGASSKAQLPADQRAFYDQISANLGAVVAVVLRGQAPVGANVVVTLRNGRPEYHEVADPLLYRSLLALNRPMRGKVTQLLGAFRRVGQRSITLSLDFMAANLFRDTLMATIMTRAGFRPLIETARGFKSRIVADQNYKDFIANGGGLSSVFLEDGKLKRRLERFYASKGIDYRTVLDAGHKVIDALDRVSESIENSTRLGEFRRATDRGENPRHAAYLAREVSTDFAMRGDNEVIAFLYDTIIFLKAGMNGMDRLYRGVAHDPNRARVAALTGALAVASLGLAAINYGNPLYDHDTEDWDKDTHWHIFVPTAAWFDFYERTGKRYPETVREARDLFHHFRLPKIWELGAVGSISERAFQRTLEGAPVEFAQDVARIVTKLVSFEYLPQVVAPLYELAINRNRFSDRPIESRGLLDLEPWARSSPYGSDALRRLGEALRNTPVLKDLYSPAKAEALLRGYFNSWAMYGLTLLDAATGDEARPDLRTDQLPIARRFYREHPAGSNATTERLYEFLEEATQARRTMRLMDKTARGEIAGEIAPTEENMSYRQLTRAQRGLQGFDAAIRALRTMKSLEQVQKFATAEGPDVVSRVKAGGQWDDIGALKRALIAELILQRNEFAEVVAKDVEARRKAQGAR